MAMDYRTRNPISTHALREEGDPHWQRTRPSTQRFLPTPSARRATARSAVLPTTGMYFYPRPPRGGRPGQSGTPRRAAHFYPRPPRGGRPCHRCVAGVHSRFLPTPSARRATYKNLRDRRPPGPDFYPRPPRGGRRTPSRTRTPTPRFLPTPSARRATLPPLAENTCGCISTHALREEGDNIIQMAPSPHNKFLPTPSARRATQVCARYSAFLSQFLPTPSARRATSCSARPCLA